MFFDTETRVYVPPLYSARKVDNLTDEYTALRKISDFINGDEDRGYIVERNVYEIPMFEITDGWIAYLEQDYEKRKNEIKGRGF